jgi:hypothetical protein
VEIGDRHVQGIFGDPFVSADRIIQRGVGAVWLGPNNTLNLSTRGFVYLRLDRLDEAIADYDAALKLNPKMAGPLYGRGIARQKKGDQAGGDADIAARQGDQGHGRRRIRKVRRELSGVTS